MDKTSAQQNSKARFLANEERRRVARAAATTEPDPLLAALADYRKRNPEMPFHMILTTAYNEGVNFLHAGEAIMIAWLGQKPNPLGRIDDEVRR
jgi:hypothetical protein